MRRAYADDLAMVLRSGLAQLQPCVFFLDFAKCSGLHLHLGETILLPLFEYDLMTLRAAIAVAAPLWRGIAVGVAAKHLGFVLGPGARGLSWSKPLEKYVARSKLWGRAG